MLGAAEGISETLRQPEAHFCERHVNGRCLSVLVAVQFHHPGSRVDPYNAVEDIVAGKNPSDDASRQRIHTR